MALLSEFLSKQRHSMISQYVNGDVLDIGCGNSIILQKFGELIDNYYGVELSAGRFEKLSKQYPNAVFLTKNLDSDPLNIKIKFDSILMVAVIEHIWNQRFLFEQLVNLLKPGGRIVITSPTNLGNDFVHPLGAKAGIFAQSAVEDHIVIYNKRRFLNLADKFGLSILKYKYFHFFCNQLVVLGRLQ